MKKLAVIAPHPVQYHAPLYQELAKADGIDLEVLYCDMMGVEEVKDKQLATFTWDVPLLDGYRYRKLKNSGTGGSRGFLSRINFSLFKIFFKEHWDVVLLQSYDVCSVWFALIAAKLSGTRVLFRGEGILHNPDPKVPRWLKRIILMPIFKLFDAVFYSCTGNQEYFRYLGVPEAKLHPLPCSVDNVFFQEEAEAYAGQREALRKELGIPSDAFVVVYAARLAPRKRQIDLLKALEQMHDTRLVVALVGDGPDRSMLETYANDHQLNQVHFTGFVNQSAISKYYALADLTVILSDHDNSPKSLNEAMNFSLPVITTDNVGTAPDLVREGINGYIIRVGDISTLVEKLRYFIEHPDAIKCMGQASLEMVSKATIERGVSSIQRVVHSLASKKEGSA